jgi:hypothetical protein
MNRPPLARAHAAATTLANSALYAALLASASAFAQSYPLPNIGSINHCASTIHAFAGGHSTQSCAVTTPGFLASKLQSDFLRNKCPSGQALRGLMNNYCVDAPNVHRPSAMSSNVHVTLCCGYAPPAPMAAPMSTAPAPVQASAATLNAPPPHTHARLFKVANVPLHMGASHASGCPQVGATYRHIDMPQTLFFRGLERSINNQCRSRGSPYGYYSMRVNSCTESVDPQHPPQVRFNATADVFCVQQ